MSFNKVKETYLIGGIVIVLVVVLSWFFLVQPRMAEAGEIGDQRVAVEAVNQKSATQIVELKGLKNGMPEERKIATALAAKFPATADEATLLRAVVTAAGKAGIVETSIKSLGPAAPILGVASGGAKLPGAEAAPAKGAAPASTGAQDLASMAITFNAEGTYTQMVSMLANLESLDRAFLITQVNLSSAEPGKFTIALQGNMYVHRTVPDPEQAKTAYCAPLKVADAYDRTFAPTTGSVKLGYLLAPAAAEAKAAGRTDVTRFLAVMIMANLTDGKQLSAEGKNLVTTEALKVAPTILSECGVDILRK